MGEQVVQRDRPEAGAGPEPGEVVGEGPLKIDHTLLLQLEQGRGGEGLGNRAGEKAGLRSHRGPGREVREAIGPHRDDAIIRHDAERGVQRSVEYAPDPEEALTILKRWKRPNDVMLVMGAGDIYSIAKQILKD